MTDPLNSVDPRSVPGEDKNSRSTRDGPRTINDKHREPASNPLTREEVAAIWLFPEDYAAKGVHARVWFQGLSAHARKSVGQFLWALDEAGR